MRLMLIEDDALIARELCLHWRAQGWVPELCITLAAAQNALESAAETGGYELIVLDLGLPDGDGLDWLRSFEGGIASRRSWSCRPVVRFQIGSWACKPAPTIIW